MPAGYSLLPMYTHHCLLPPSTLVQLHRVYMVSDIMVNILIALYLACNEERAFFASEEHKQYDLWSCQKVTDALIYLLVNIYIRFGSKLYRQNVGIPMGANCAPLLLICFCSAM